MAQSPWGDLTVSDAHVHFFSHQFYSGLARQKKAANAEELALVLEWQIPPADPQFLDHSWITELDKYGVQLLWLFYGGSHASRRTFSGESCRK